MKCDMSKTDAAGSWPAYCPPAVECPLVRDSKDVMTCPLKLTRVEYYVHLEDQVEGRRYTEDQIVGMLMEIEAGASVASGSCKHSGGPIACGFTDVVHRPVHVDRARPSPRLLRLLYLSDPPPEFE